MCINLKKPGEFRLSVGYMRGSLHQAGDYSTQSQQGGVYTSSLTGPTSGGSTPSHIFAAGQIDEVQLTHSDNLFAFNTRFLLAGKHSTTSAEIKYEDKNK